ncbi:MAG TPA: hypothetical protein VJ996_05745 [Solirubrobacteraceae bacterium]|nr:hypothetical protein [Solirubrobacteraceae bacterium]
MTRPRNPSRPRRLSRLPRLPRLLAAIGIPLALLCGLSIVPTTGVAGGAPLGSAQAPRAHAASSYLTGIGDEQGEMFGNPLWQQLHTKIVRYIAPYDAVAHSYSLDRAKLWIREAEAHHQQVLVAFYHSEYTPTRMPSVAQYKHDVQKFVKLFPHVRQYQSWDEANRGNEPHQFSSPSAVAAAQYYQVLIRVCHGCTAIGLDVLDQANISSTLEYISEFKREIGRLRTIMPKIWGLHDYSDINRLESWRTHELVRAFGGQVWLTETGGIVQFGGSFPNQHGSGLTRAARVLKYMFAVAGSSPQIKRLYIYDWTGCNASTRFDAGLTNAHDKPRPGYVVVCRALHAAHCGNVKLARN